AVLVEVTGRGGTRRAAVRLAVAVVVEAVATAAARGGLVESRGTRGPTGGRVVIAVAADRDVAGRRDAGHDRVRRVAGPVLVPVAIEQRLALGAARVEVVGKPIAVLV